MRPPDSLRSLLPLLVFLLLLSACGNAPEPVPTETPDVSTSAPQDTGPADPADALVGDWIVISVGGEAVVSPPILTMTFEEAGNVAGEGGCNGFGGTYSADESSAITFTGIAATLMACDDAAVMEQERTYFQALEQASVYILDGDSLTLSNENGDALVVLQRDEN